MEAGVTSNACGICMLCCAIWGVPGLLHANQAALWCRVNAYSVFVHDYAQDPTESLLTQAEALAIPAAHRRAPHASLPHACWTVFVME